MMKFTEERKISLSVAMFSHNTFFGLNHNINEQVRLHSWFEIEIN